MNTENITRWDQEWAIRFPKRITGVQKEAFLQMLEQELQVMGYSIQRFTLKNLVKNHQLATECEKPAVIFTAHYDTPTVMPFWISLLYRFIGHTRQIAAMIVLIVLFLLPLLISIYLSKHFPNLEEIVTFFLAGFNLLLVASCISFFIPNPNNREDNTSGVIGLMALADWIKDKPELKDKVQFAFFDNEEWGLLGSGALKEHWDSIKHSYQQATLINLDCISRGQVPLVVYHGKPEHAQRLLPFLQKHLPESRVMDMKFFPLSDNYTFRKLGAINISYADSSSIAGGYYIPRIHGPKDNDLSPERLAAGLDGLVEFLYTMVEKM